MEKNWFTHPVMAVLGGLVLISLIAFIGVATSNQVKEGRYIGRPDTERDTITITGEGRVTAIPDIGQVTVTIRTEDRDASRAQERNIEQFNEVIEALKKEGIEKEDLKTASYNVFPRYNYDEGEQTLIGYEVTQSLSVKIRDLDKAGNVIRVAAQNGVNQVSGLNFTIDDPEQYRQEARKEALDNAQEKAEELAKIAGVKLGKIISFSESSSGNPQPYPVYARQALTLEAADSFAEPQIEAGSEEVYVNATIEYEIF